MVLSLGSKHKDPLTILNEWPTDVPMTIESGPLDRGEGLRQICSYYKDGRMLVSKTHAGNPQILSLMAEIRLMGYPDPNIDYVDMNKVQSSYDDTGDVVDLRVKAEDVRMRREVISLVDAMGRRRASDIHIIVYEQSCTVRARIDGMMTLVAEWPPEYGHRFCAAAFTMADAADVNYQPYEYQGARVSNRKDLQLPDGIMSLRLQFNPTIYSGRALIIRLLYSSDEKSAGDIRALGFTAEQLEDFEYLRAKPFGINIVAGPTGHGKSTTLQRNIISILKENNYNIAVYTVEDPPEYTIHGAVQMPVVNANTAEERSRQFTKAIAAALRSNPDRLMIGEVRDPASAQLAFEAAMTGHQVWTTLHANDAVTIPFRLRDLEVEHYKIGDPDLLTGLISQRLMRILCPDCCKTINENDLPAAMLARLEAAEVPVERLRRRNMDGCSSCGAGNGYKGRTVVAEIILPDHKFMEYVRGDQKAEAERYWLTHLGGRNMIERTIDLMLESKVDPFDAERTVGPIARPDRSGKA